MSSLQYLVMDVTTASGSIIHAVCRFLQSYSNAKRITCFGRLSADILSVFLATSQYLSSLCLQEITLFVRLDGEHPSSGHIISRLDLPHVDEIKNLVVNPRSGLQMFGFSKLFVVSSSFLGWCYLSCAGTHSGSCCSSWPCRVPTYLVNSCYNFNFYVTEVVGHLSEVQ